MLSVSWLLIALPLLSFFVLMLSGRRADAWGHWAGVGVSGATAIIGIVAFFEMIGRGAADRAESGARDRRSRSGSYARLHVHDAEDPAGCAPGSACRHCAAGERARADGPGGTSRARPGRGSDIRGGA